MSQTTTPSGADVLAVLDRKIAEAEGRATFYNALSDAKQQQVEESALKELRSARAAVAALIAREAALVAERDALAAEVGALLKDAERYRLYRLYKTSGAWPRFRGQEPGLCAWGGTHAGRDYTGEVIDEMMDRLLECKYTRPIIDAAIDAARAEAGHG